MDGKVVPVLELITDKKGYALSPNLRMVSLCGRREYGAGEFKSHRSVLVKVDEDSREPMVWEDLSMTVRLSFVKDREKRMHRQEIRS